MKRRTLLQAVAGAGTAALAGCTGTPDGGSGGDGGDGNYGGTGGTTTPDTTTAPETTTSASSVTGTLFQVRAVECGVVEPSATVTYDDGEVVVDGVLPGNDGCTRARLGSAGYADGTLTVGVESYTETDGVCKQCTTEVRYTATVRMDGAPERVVVTHDGSEVASESAQE